MDSQTLYQKTKKSIGRATLAGLAVLSLNGCEFFENPVARNPTRDEFDKHWGTVSLVRPEEGDENSAFPNIWNRDIRDLDGDGLADAITSGFRAYWVAEGYQGTGGVYRGKNGVSVLTENARIMTPEIRAAATRALNGDQDLAYLIAQENYSLEQDGRNQ